MSTTCTSRIVAMPKQLPFAVAPGADRLRSHGRRSILIVGCRQSVLRPREAAKLGTALGGTPTIGTSPKTSAFIKQATHLGRAGHAARHQPSSPTQNVHRSRAEVALHRPAG